MGISSIKSTSPTATLGLWKMTESWQDILSDINLPEEELAPLHALTKEKRKWEWLACRKLFSEITGKPPIIRHNAERKPYAEHFHGYISFSHSGDYACVYIDTVKSAGVDIQQMKPSIEKGIDYFLDQEEQSWVDSKNNLLLHLIWSAKEAVFKMAGDADLDLRKHFTAKPFSTNQNEPFEVCIHRSSGEQAVNVAFDTFDDYVLTWTI
jgi:4'-phosphopantetheinyl transferase